MNQRIIAAASGILFIVFAFISLSSIDPLREATDAELIKWWSDSANLDTAVLSMWTRLAAVPFFLIFLVPLRARLRRSDTGGWSDLLLTGGALFASMMAFSAITRGVTALSIQSNNEPLPGVDTLRFLTELSVQGFALGAVTGIALVIGTTSFLVLRDRTLPAWFGWLGVPVAAISFVALPLQVAALTAPLHFIWVLAACVALIRVKEAAGEAEVYGSASGRLQAT